MVIVSSNVLEVFDGFNFSHHQLPKLYRESERLLKKVMSFFVKSPSNRNLKDLTKTTRPLFVGDSTAALIVHLSLNDGENVALFL